MNKKWSPRITMVVAFVVWIVFGLAKVSTLAAGGTPEGDSNVTVENSPVQQQQPLQQQQQTTQQPAQTASQYWTGNGGRGMRLGILVPHSQGLTENQGYLPTLIQGVLVSDISKYSAISVLDRVSLDRVITETLDLTYEDDLDIVRLGRVAQVGYMMTGNIIKTSTGFSLQINVTDTTPQANTIASYLVCVGTF